ncbi:hypothetical protein M408DRAFT_311254 [Serendipita vermifera MAFF 305830]|uniref:Manganese lipoxygenase n=1 Tax=Serendipita vermifera MAFF 305830 TaxID=933852 RepID=A0A0C3AS46_SERVB|nr:hypothetical protein M408DRAFT_311254 [Serendipita vermifera MAFF 305830]
MSGTDEKTPIPDTLGPTQDQFRQWDKGIFASELVKYHIYPGNSMLNSDGTTNPSNESESFLSPIEIGTWRGTKMALSEVFDRITERHMSYFDVVNFEPALPQNINLNAKKDLYTFQRAGSDNYPPHLDIIPRSDRTGLLKIFNAMRLIDTGTLLLRIIPASFLKKEHGDPIRNTIAGIEQRNKELRLEKRDVFEDPNIGDREDWYTDKVFAQQQFTGPNPTTIERASDDWITQFSKAAQAQGNQDMLQILSAGHSDESMYIQDCSYFRKAWGVAPDATMSSADGKRFACASVTLFRLDNDGKLHPLAIVIDYKGSIDNSIVLFNRRLRPTDSTSTEPTDWPWRYAKTCAQISDWTRHEITVHLVNTHLVEEVVIVAAHRSFQANHITLSLNASACSTLAPKIIAKVIGTTESQVYSYINHAYANFDWEKHYVPNDLAARGFPVNEVETGAKKYHNYSYARNMITMWHVLRTFVSSVLATKYTSDDQVVQDVAIELWCNEMRSISGGQMQSFPMIKTIGSLVDAVTMCIHIASPQHTAINYLQEYYQSFVINKPPALSASLPTSLTVLQGYKEPDLIDGLPVKDPRSWLLSSHLPYLLSFRVAADQNLVNYARSMAEIPVRKGKDDEAAIQKAGKELLRQLIGLVNVFKRNSDDMDDHSVPYYVMDPNITAVSILI